MNQLSLLRTRKFAAFFWTQFLGAFNDNLFKNALVILVAFKSLSVGGLPPEQVVVVLGGLFILPFFLFSASAGQLADKYPKFRLVRWIKGAEILVMALGAAGFLTENLGLLLGALFLMGLQSTLFGPVKYSILPELLAEDDLVGGNALVESGTFLAILLGTIAGLAVSFGEAGPRWVAGAVTAVAALGFVSSFLVPRTRPGSPALEFSWNPVTPAMETYRFTRRNRTVFLSVLGVAWFWFFGSALIYLLPIYTKSVLLGSERVYTLFLALFCVGTGAGSLLCERLSGHKLELGLVPFGSIGMTLFAFDLFLVGEPQHGPDEAAALLGVREFLAAPGGIRILADLLGLAVFSGLYTVPLYTLIQQRSDPTYRSRVIAGNNILGALFMVLSSLLLGVLLALELRIPQILLVLALLNAAAALYIYHVIPEFLLRFVAWLLTNVMYRLKTVHRERIPLDGPAVLVCNHVSFVDWLVIAGACKRPARFVMYHGFLKLPLLGWLFRDAKVIPIAPARESVQTLAGAYDRIARELEAGEIVCIFPEGKVTHDGRLNPFRPGIEKIVARTPVPVIPMALRGLWGSFFSRRGGRAMRRPFRRFWSRIQLVIGDAVPPQDVTAQGLGARVAQLGGFDPPPALEPRPAPTS